MRVILGLYRCMQRFIGLEFLKSKGSVLESEY